MIWKKTRRLLAKNSPFKLPVLPKEILEWIKVARPYVGGKKRDFRLEPFWPDVYGDDHPNIMILSGRQTFKTTFCTDILGYYSTTQPNSELSYVVDSHTHLSAFSRQRLRRQTFLQNPLLKKFLPNGRANVGEIILLNGSILYLLTHTNQYQKVESRSNTVLVLDEAQYHDIQFLSKALYTLTQTRGRLFILGIGGEAGSEYHKLWNRTDQREWIYDDKDWREKLRFDSQENIINEHPENILSGKWIPQKPENKMYRGYHMPQIIFARIPLTIDDAINLYKTQPDLSIEYQEKNNPHSIYISHTLGEFYKAERRPITPEMVYACMEPYRYLSLLKPEEVVSFKNTFGNEIRILMGVDFGSGKSSSTVVSILIKWKKSGRYQLAWIEKRPTEHQLDQARYLALLGMGYAVDYGVGDLGYGQISVKMIQDGGTDSQNNKFEGLRRKFVGCRTIGDETKPKMEFKQETDEHGTQVGRIQIDKTTSIQKFVDLVGTYVSHPINKDEKWKRTKLMIPSKIDFETDWLLEDFCRVTRKDLPKTDDLQKEDPRQRARKEFNHPPDSVMSLIYCLTADENYREGPYHIRGVHH